MRRTRRGRRGKWGGESGEGVGEMGRLVVRSTYPTAFLSAAILSYNATLRARSPAPTPARASAKLRLACRSSLSRTMMRSFSAITPLSRRRSDMLMLSGQMNENSKSASRSTGSRFPDIFGYPLSAGSGFREAEG